jgi:hypothetical protein
MDVSKIKLNDSNPRTIRDENFEKLCKSIEQFPKMMELRPIIIDQNGVILGGNMRFRALLKLGYKKIPDGWVKIADKLTADEQRRFVIEDNVSFGDWNWDVLANEWNATELLDWGLEIPHFDAEDVKTSDEANDNINFIIKCDDDDQLKQLKAKFGITANRMEFVEFMARVTVSPLK